ncbi:ABC transporter ATP-binding protein [Methylobacterium sp. W2]|uniref:dipeptide ABC transporter ATP-binding protein n=1 Tax=Methylobacterium sp. W2 TaxID=2598107 RepID=UPI001D0CC473|nr:ABC transporter ATP-binding protein [Methylobacterium sp. W2]MCC0808119.1 ABC transporter ATP-binding protein [Methylobacterium sp. W2]
MIGASVRSEPVLSITGLTVPLPRGADRANAIEGLSLSVGPNEIVCVVGESGSGKSITASAVMGLLPPNLSPSAGQILLQGEDVLKVGPARLRALRGSRMAMVFQEPMTALNPVLKVGDQIAEMLEAHSGRGGREARRRRVLDLLGDVHLPDPPSLAKAYPHQLSGGQRQRVMIAMALANDPALIIADEPTTALDVTTQAQILKLLKELQARRNAGILFITHDFGVVSQIADRVVVMQKGRLVEEGSAEDVLTRPRDPYTRMLIAAVPRAEPPPPRPRRQPSAPILAVRDLTKTYGGRGLFGGGRAVTALDSVSLALQPGETLGIVGESGSGKSTLARCVARFVDPSAGHIRIGGDDIALLPTRELRPYRRRVQMVFQDPYRSLNPRRTVGQSIIEGPMNYGLSKEAAWARATRLLDLVHLDAGALDRYPHEFSGGQRQRIAIARALAMEPDVLIADEAVSALDVSVQRQVLELLEDIRERLNLSILFITHDLRVAARLCDRLVVMLGGRIVEEGATAALFANPRHAYTQALFAAAPKLRVAQE